MAKAPSARVPKTSGQGVSRLSYQRGYAMRNPKDTPKVDDKIAKPDKQREYGKARGSSKPKKAGGGINISYGDTLPIGDLKDIEEFPRK